MAPEGAAAWAAGRGAAGEGAGEAAGGTRAYAVRTCGTRTPKIHSTHAGCAAWFAVAVCCPVIGEGGGGGHGGKGGVGGMGGASDGDTGGGGGDGCKMTGHRKIGSTDQSLEAKLCEADEVGGGDGAGDVWVCCSEVAAASASSR